MKLRFLGESIWSSVNSTHKSYHLNEIISWGHSLILNHPDHKSGWFWKTWCSFLFYNFSLLFSNTHFYHQVLKCTLWVLDFGNVTRVCAWFISSPLTFKSSQELLGDSFHIAKVSLPAFIFLAFSVPPLFFKSRENQVFA